MVDAVSSSATPNLLVPDAAPSPTPAPDAALLRRQTTGSLCVSSGRRAKPLLFDTGCASLAGSRYGHLNQDDIHVQQVLQPEELSRVGGQQCYVAAVCDGHGLLGEYAARSACRAVLRVLCFGPLQMCNMAALGKEVMQDALSSAFVKGHKAAVRVYDNPPLQYSYPVNSRSRDWTLARDAESNDKVYACQGSSGRSAERVLECGTTCTVALAQGNTVWVANVGDSAAVMGKQFEGGAVEGELLSVKHSCSNPLEDARMALQTRASDKRSRSGGVKVPKGDRWGGESVAMTRALGHRLLERHGVSPVPHICCVERRPEDKCLIVASDGVWDVLSPATATQFVLDALEAGSTATEAAKALSQKAVDLQMCMWGVADNTSAAVVSFL